MLTKNLHFVGNLATDEFLITDYLAIKSAKTLNPDFSVYYWHSKVPSQNNGWWTEASKLITHPIRIESPDIWCGQQIKHHAHQADLIRLAALYTIGGVYLDMDTLCVNSFPDWFGAHDLVIGIEYDSSHKIAGLCNAVMAGKPMSKFLLEWLSRYRTFDQSKWSDHSVILPFKMHTEPVIGCFPVHRKLLGPMWWEFERLWNETVNLDDVYCFHLWNSYSRDHMRKMTAELIKTQPNTYSVYASRFL